MSIVTVTVLQAHCDGCGAVFGLTEETYPHWEPDTPEGHESMDAWLAEDGDGQYDRWQTDGNKHRCPECRSEDTE